MNMTSAILRFTGTALVLTAVGCGGSSSSSSGSAVAQATGAQSVREAADTGRSGAGTTGRRGMMGGMMGRMMGGQADTSAAPTAEATPATAPGCPEISPALVEDGRKIFSGPGTCFACHGANAKGSVVAPNLTDSTWLNIDGSYAAIAELVRSGVPHPKKFPAPMPPMGGAQLSTQQICAVAAYVHGLGGGKG